MTEELGECRCRPPVADTANRPGPPNVNPTANWPTTDYEHWCYYARYEMQTPP